LKILINRFISQEYNKAFLPAEEAGTRIHEDEENDEEFDPWALPELQDLGPKWSGKF